jgi:hypothetical protein
MRNAPVVAPRAQFKIRRFKWCNCTTRVHSPYTHLALTAGVSPSILRRDYSMEPPRITLWSVAKLNMLAG